LTERPAPRNQNPATGWPGRLRKPWKVQANKKRKEPDFDVGDYVHVSRKGWRSDRPDLKLDFPNDGPFRIVQKYSMQTGCGRLEWIPRPAGGRQSRSQRRSREGPSTKWTKGWDQDATWYPAGNFKNAAIRLRAFHEKHPDADEPPVRLAEWERAALEETSDPDHVDDDRPEHYATQRQRRGAR
jgi:hypothetical protein